MDQGDRRNSWPQMTGAANQVDRGTIGEAQRLQMTGAANPDGPGRPAQLVATDDRGSQPGRPGDDRRSAMAMDLKPGTGEGGTFQSRT